MSYSWVRRLIAVGPAGAAGALWSLITGAGAGPTPAHPFDSEHAIDAGGLVSWRALQAGRPADAFNAGYLGVDPHVARAALERVVGRERYTFVDLGCGKGRALVVAAGMGVREAIGVELSGVLAAAAVRNAAQVRARFPDYAPIRVIEADAGGYALPPGPLIVFLYHPFAAPVMRAAARRLAEALQREPREAVVIYVNPRLAGVFDALAMLERVDPSAPQTPDAERPVLWRTITPAPALDRVVGSAPR